MRALSLKGPNELILETIDPPRAGAGEVVVNVEITSLGGSESAAYRNPGMRPLPNIMGHGICGVTESNQRVAIFPLSGCQQCHYCQNNLPQLCDDWNLIGVQKPGGFAEQVAVPESALVEIPDELAWEQACFIEPFANTLNAWERAQPNLDDTILIVGAGSLGLGLAAIARERGFAEVFACDHSATRLEAASQLGIRTVAQTADNGFDVVFETVGTPEARSIAIDSTRKSGKTVFLGFASPTTTVDFTRMIREQKTFLGSFVFSREQFERAIPLAQMCSPEWVRNLSLEEVAGQLAEYADGNFNVVKSALRPQKTA